MLQRKANTYRLYPDAGQSETLARIAGACRAVYNLALEQRRDWWGKYKNQTRKSISFAGQCRELTTLRQEVDWLREAPIHPLQQALRDLDKAYQNFFSGRSGYPSPRCKGRNDSFRFPDPVSLRVERTGRKTGRIKLPKLGWVAFRGWYDLPGAIKNITVSRRGGRWFASVQCEREVPDPAPSELPAVGIDMGVSVFAALSNGTMIAPKNVGQKALKALRKAQRSIARKKKGSANRRKAILRVQRLHARVANARKDFLHKISTIIAKNHGTVVVEDLKMRNMTASATGTIEEPGRNIRQKSGLNRSILDQAWGLFFTFLSYKLPERGGRLIKVPPAYTSQTCSACGVTDSASRISQARFSCVACGHTENADTNASKIILRRADCPLKPVEGHRIGRPCEAGSTGWAA